MIEIVAFCTSHRRDTVTDYTINENERLYESLRKLNGKLPIKTEDLTLDKQTEHAKRTRELTTLNKRIDGRKLLRNPYSESDLEFQCVLRLYAMYID